MGNSTSKNSHHSVNRHLAGAHQLPSLLRTGYDDFIKVSRMGKNPAFLFYPNDYLGGTMHFTLEMHGAYLKILLHQFNHGDFTEKEATAIVGEVWQEIKHKFIENNGKFYQNRLKNEIHKRTNYCNSRTSNGLHEKAYAKHMENENEDVIEDVNVIKNTNTIPPTKEQVSAYCLERHNSVDPETFINFYEAKGWMIGKNKMKDWMAAVRTWEKHDTGNTTLPKKSMSQLRAEADERERLAALDKRNRGEGPQVNRDGKGLQGINDIIDSFGIK